MIRVPRLRIQSLQFVWQCEPRIISLKCCKCWTFFYQGAWNAAPVKWSINTSWRFGKWFFSFLGFRFPFAVYMCSGFFWSSPSVGRRPHGGSYSVRLHTVWIARSASFRRGVTPFLAWNLLQQLGGKQLCMTINAKWVFPKIGVPQNGRFIMENPIKMDDLGVPPF